MHGGTDRPGSIAVIGTGRVGTAVHASARDRGLESVAVSRTELASESLDLATPEIAVLAVPDREITSACAQVLGRLGSPRLIGHTSGATGLSALEEAERGGAAPFSIHPLQTFARDNEPLEGTPCAVTARNDLVLGEVSELATRLGLVPFRLDDGDRVGYHAAASIASNFLVSLEEAAVEALEQAGVDGGRELLVPLVSRTVENWAKTGAGALTGPIARGDEETVSAHSEWIESELPELADLYRSLAARTRLVAAKGSRN